MEVKSIDTLLNELNNVQLSKDSMSGITGGYTMCWKTKSGLISIQYDDEDLGKIKSIKKDGRPVYNLDICSSGTDNTSTTPGEICQG